MDLLTTDRYKMTVPITPSYIIGWFAFVIGTYLHYFKEYEATNMVTTLGLLMLLHYLVQVPKEKAVLVAWGLWFAGLIVQVPQLAVSETPLYVLPFGLIIVLSFLSLAKKETLTATEFSSLTIVLLLYLFPFEWGSALLYGGVIMGLYRKEQTPSLISWLWFFYVIFMTFQDASYIYIFLMIIGSLVLSDARNEESIHLPFLSFVLMNVFAYSSYILYASFLFGLFE